MTTISTDEQALAELNTTFIAAVAAGDIALLDEKVFAADFVSSNPDGSFIGRAEYLRIVPEQPAVSDLHGDDVVIRIFDDHAIIHTHITWINGDGTRGHGRFTDDYVRRDGRWQCISAHVTSYPNHPVVGAALL